MQTPEEFCKAIENTILMGAQEGPVYCKNIDCIWAEVENNIRARDAEIRRECAEDCIKAAHDEWFRDDTYKICFSRIERAIRAVVIGEEE